MQKLNDCLPEVENPVRLLDLQVITKNLLSAHSNFFSLGSLPRPSKKMVKEHRDLSKLALQTQGKPLDKSEQMADWGRRPLSESQLRYAALDAFCLLEIHQVIANVLKKKKKETRSEEDFLVPQQTKKKGNKRKV